MANPAIETLLEQAHVDQNKLVAIIDSVTAALVEDKLAYRLKLPPHFVGVHPCNRDGAGLNEQECHALGHDIVSMGWSFAACQDATAIEDDEHATIEKYTQELCNGSARLATFQTGQVKVGSLSCSHTNAFLAAVLDEATSSVESISENGRLSISKITANDEQLRLALQGGLTWLIYKAQVAKLYPLLPALVQQAKNQVGTSAREESDVQLMMRVNNVAKRMSDADGNVPWPDVMKTMKNGNLPKHVDITSLCTYVQHWSGGRGGEFLHELLIFTQQNVPPGRLLASSTLDVLSSLKLQPAEL